MSKNNLFTLLFLFAIIAPSILVAQDQNLLLATEQLNVLAEELNYAEQDITNPIVSDNYTSQGITHIYYQQRIGQIGIFGTNASVHIKNNQVIASNLQFLKGLGKREIKKVFQVQALEAIARLALDKGYPLSQTELLILESDESDPQQPTTVSTAGISNRVIPMKLVFIENNNKNLQLVWSVFIDEVEGTNYKNFLINTSTGAIEKEINLTISCNFDPSQGEHNYLNNNVLEKLLNKNKKISVRESGIEKVQVANSYNVYPIPIESPNFGSRSIEISPWNNNTTASPNGWHQIGATTYTLTTGNNVDAYDDSNNSPGGNAARANGGATLDFNFPLVLSAVSPAPYKNAAITNLFYWNNIIHDVWYNYGFDEPSGNFQEDNFSRGGNGSDYVYAEAQDGSGSCNANFSTPSDGGNPRMQMYVCGNRDGDLDNGVIVHEYGHGISIRLTGGPATSGCLNNQEQMGEGWSDWFGMVMTIQPGDIATKPRPMGTWLFEQGPTGSGIRPYPYTTNMAVNPMTYGTLPQNNISVPHGVGSIWATMLWDLTWAMIDKYGWDADLYNGTGGNNKTMALVILGLKLQPCSPGFVDGREAILAADRVLNGGANECLIWESFARRGLGYSASQGSTGSKSDGVEAFDMPPSCTITLRKTADKTTAGLGEEITYQITATNNQSATLNNLVLKDFLPSNLEFVSASNGGSANGQTITWPTVNLPSGQSLQETLIAKVKSGIQQVDTLFTDDLEAGTANWTVNTESGNAIWNYQTALSNSATHAYHSPGTSPDSRTNLTTTTSLYLTDSSELIFNHFYDLELEWDAGVIEISIDNGATWIDLGGDITQNNYNPTPTRYGFSGFHGNSGGWIETKADLSPYAGNKGLIRFQMRYDFSVFNPGWYIDDISVTNLGLSVLNQAEISDGNITTTTNVEQATNIIFNQNICENTLIAQFDEADIATGDYRIANDITSKGTIKNGSMVGFYAGSSITLQVGFQAVVGADFIAKIEACKVGGGTSSLLEDVSNITPSNTDNKLAATLNKKLENTALSLAIRPNPFNNQAIIDYQLNSNSTIWIGLHDITGKVIKVLINHQTKEKGSYQLRLNNDQLQSGVYWLTMRTAGEVLTKKVFLVKN